MSGSWLNVSTPMIVAIQHQKRSLDPQMYNKAKNECFINLRHLDEDSDIPILHLSNTNKAESINESRTILCKITIIYHWMK